jgi:hypothetical protein
MFCRQESACIQRKKKKASRQHRSTFEGSKRGDLGVMFSQKKKKTAKKMPPNLIILNIHHMNGLLPLAYAGGCCPVGCLEYGPVGEEAGGWP